MTSVLKFFNLLLMFAVFFTSFTYLSPHPRAGSPQVLGAATVHLPPHPEQALLRSWGHQLFLHIEYNFHVNKRNYKIKYSFNHYLSHHQVKIGSTKIAL